MATRARRAAACGGFTYLGVLILLAVIGLVGAYGLKMGALLQRAAAEQELLDIGAAFSAALASYAAATPPGQLAQPPSLQELLKDPRFPAVRRHLRQIYVDPITGKAEWGFMYLGQKERLGIVAVYSLSAAKPFKQGNFDARFINFGNKAHFSDWKFTATGQGAVAPPPLLAPGQTSPVPVPVPVPLTPGAPPLPGTAPPSVPTDASPEPAAQAFPPEDPPEKPESEPSPQSEPEPEPQPASPPPAEDVKPVATSAVKS